MLFYFSLCIKFFFALFIFTLLLAFLLTRTLPYRPNARFIRRIFGKTESVDDLPEESPFKKPINCFYSEQFIFGQLHSWIVYKNEESKDSKNLLIFLHDVDGHIGFRTPFYTNLCSVFDGKLLTFDYRGFGKSSSADFKEQNLIDDLRMVLEYSKILLCERIVLYGKGVGASVILKFLQVNDVSEYKVAGIILENCPLSIPKAYTDSVVANVTPKISRFFETRLSISFLRVICSFLGSDLSTFLRRILRLCILLIMKFVKDTWDITDCFEPLKSNQEIPVLLLAGLKDANVPPFHTKIILQELQVTFKSGHLLKESAHYDGYIDPTYNGVIYKFLATCAKNAEAK